MSLNYTKQFIRDNFFELVFSIPKTIWFNFKVLPIKKAIRLPFIVSYHVRIRGINRNTFIVEKEDLSTASMRIGFGDSLNARRESKKALLQVNGDGKIICKGSIGLSQGVVIIVDSACLTLGDHFRCNYSTTIDCKADDIVFGDEVACGWNVTIKNHDGHTVTENGCAQKNSGAIHVGNHVWICAFSTILKGNDIGDDSVIAYGTLLAKSQGEKNVLYAGVPGKLKKNNINWIE